MVDIRYANKADFEAIAAVIESIELYYGATNIDPLDIRLAQTIDVLDSRSAFALLAEEAGELAGFASYSFVWPAAGASKSLYLKELFVFEEYRRGGVATALMERLTAIARSERCSRIEWTTDRSNPAADKFYDRLGCKPSDEKIFYRMNVG